MRSIFDPRLAFELLLGPVIARGMASSEGVKTLNSETVIRAVLYGISTPDPAKRDRKFAKR